MQLHLPSGRPTCHSSYGLEISNLFQPKRKKIEYCSTNHLISKIESRKLIHQLDTSTQLFFILFILLIFCLFVVCCFFLYQKKIKVLILHFYSLLFIFSLFLFFLFHLYSNNFPLAAAVFHVQFIWIMLHINYSLTSIKLSQQSSALKQQYSSEKGNLERASLQICPSKNIQARNLKLKRKNLK